MSAYHKEDHRCQTQRERFLASCPDAVQVSLSEVIASAHEGLLALCSATGFAILRDLMEAEVTGVCDPKGKHNPHRTAVRHGAERGRVVLGGREARLERPRCRTTMGCQEVPLRTYVMFQRQDMLTVAVMERFLYGLSTRRYTHGLEPIDSRIETVGFPRAPLTATSSPALSKPWVSFWPGAWTKNASWS